MDFCSVPKPIKTCNCLEKFPKYLSTDDNPPRDPHWTLHVLSYLLTNKISEDLKDRHLILLDQIIKGCKYGFFLTDLKYVIPIIECLVEKIKYDIEYVELFVKFLEICAFPPLLMQMGEKLVEMRYFDEYLTALGNALICLINSEIQMKLIQIITVLLTSKPETLTIHSMRHEWIVEGMERNRLPEILIELLETCPYDQHTKIIEICIIICDLSLKICHKMIAANAFNILMLRFDNNSLNCKPGAINLPISDMWDMWENIQDSVNKGVDVLWSLVMSLKDASPEFIETIQPPCQNALWCLRIATRVSLIKAQYHYCIHKIALALSLMQYFPEAEYITSGFAEVCTIASTLTEVNVKQDTWIHFVKFDYNDKFIIIKKMVMLTLCTFGNNSYIQKIMKENHTIHGLIILVSLQNKKFDKYERLTLAKYALHVLYVIGLGMIDDFIEYDGIVSLLMLMEMYVNEKNDIVVDKRMIEQTLKVFYKFARTNNEQFIKTAQKHFTYASLTHFCNKILSKQNLTIHYKKILSYAFGILKFVKDDSQQQASTVYCLLVTYFKQIVNPTPLDMYNDIKTTIVAIDLLWTLLQNNLSKIIDFFSDGGIYTFLDLLLDSPFIVQVFGLGCLVDLCQSKYVVPFIITWRGGPKRNINIYAFLASVFNHENKEIGVRTTDNSVIKSVYSPIMGLLQRHAIYKCNCMMSSSPSILEMYASCRPKVYAILQLLQRHKPITTMVKLHFDVSTTPLSIKQQNALIMAENFLTLKISETWRELRQDIKRLKIKPIVIDREMLDILIKENDKWVLCVKKRQEENLNKEHNEQVSEERNLYNLLRECKIQDAIDVVKELKCITRTADRMFLLQHKKKQNEDIYAYQKDIVCERSHLPSCFRHKTYNNSINVTALFNQEHILDYN